MMQANERLLIAGLILCAAFTAMAGAASAQTASELEQIVAAIPAAAAVPPAGPRKLLVFTLCRGFPHGSITYASKAVEMMGEKTGAFEAVVSNDIAMFEPGRLGQFDAVLMNNTTGELFLPPNLGDLPQEEQAARREYDAMLKQSLLEFVRNGKGIAGIHAATDCFYQWPEYGEMMGGYFDGHPWHEPVTLKIDDPLHPLCRAFTNTTFQITDEIYQFRGPYSRDTLRVLLSLDISRTDMNKGDSIHRTDNDFAVSWVRRYGKGRVFYCSLGHRNEVFWNPTVLKHYLDGIQFVLGDLEADTTPSAALDETYRERLQDRRDSLAFEQAFDQIAAYQYGQVTDALNLIEDRVRRSHGHPETREALAGRLADLLDSDGTAAAKRFACMQLSVCGTENEVPVLAKLLGDPEMADMSRYALARIPGRAADKALRAALARARGAAQIGVINALGQRRDKKAVKDLAELANGPDTPAAEAGIHALGAIGGRHAARALGELRSKPGAPAGVDDAYLRCIDTLAERGRPRRAAKRYQNVYESTAPGHIRAAAFRGLVLVRGPRSVPAIVEALTSDDPYLRDTAAQCVLALPGRRVTESLAKAVSDQPPESQVVLISLLADRGDARALPEICAACSAPAEAARIAALEAIGKLGDRSCVLALARAATAANESERDAARASLATLPGPGVNAAILAELSEGRNPAAVRAELARALAGRNAVSAAPCLLEIAQKSEPAVQDQAFTALGVLGRPENLPGLLEALARVENEAARDAAQQAVVAVARKFDDTDESVGMLSTAVGAVEHVPTKAALLRVLSRVGGEMALATVHQAMDSDDAALRDAGIRALCAWHEPVVMDELLDLAATADDETQQALALRGLLRLLAEDMNRAGKSSFKMSRSMDDILAVCKRAMTLAEYPQEKRTVLSCVAKARTPAAKAFVAQYLNDDVLSGEAQLACQALDASGPAATASDLAPVAHRAIDGDLGSRWDTGYPQRPGQWFMLDLGAVKKIEKVMLDTTPSGNDYPRGYEVFVSTNQGDWRQVAAGKGTSAAIEITFPRTAARFIAITLTAEHEVWFWSIHEITVE